VGAETRREPPGLVVGAVGARRQLPVLLLTGEPRLEVDLLRRRRAELSRADVHQSVRDAESLHDLLLDRDEELVLRAGLLRPREAEHLHLVELVDAEHAPGVLAVRAGLTAEARRVARVAERQPVVLEDLPLMGRREGNLRRSDGAGGG